VYDASIARFLQEDSHRGSLNDPLSLNLYSYCHNEPVMYFDPSGYADKVVTSVTATPSANGNTVKVTTTTANGTKYTTTMCFAAHVHMVSWIYYMPCLWFEQGKKRAEYGKRILKGLSDYLTSNLGKGFSAESLRLMRKFFLIYSPYEISKSSIWKFNPSISWTHYIQLMRINNEDERRFYELEIANNGWTVKEFQRQFDTSLYERLALSRDKKKVRELAEKGQIIESPQDLFKDPYVLEFTGLSEKSSYSETGLEQKLIDHLQQFLLELGKGFAFVDRQVRSTFEEESFYVDLVFYNRLLRCFVLVDLKIGRLKHKDIGQLQTYVNYYDRHGGHSRNLQE